MRWLVFTVGQRNGFQTALSSHLAKTSLASGGASCAAAYAHTRS
jgi:hypothetical protein